MPYNKTLRTILYNIKLHPPFQPCEAPKITVFFIFSNMLTLRLSLKYLKLTLIITSPCAYLLLVSRHMVVVMEVPLKILSLLPAQRISMVREAGIMQTASFLKFRQNRSNLS